MLSIFQVEKTETLVGKWKIHFHVSDCGLDAKKTPNWNSSPALFSIPPNLMTQRSKESQTLIKEQWQIRDNKIPTYCQNTFNEGSFVLGNCSQSLVTDIYLVALWAFWVRVFFITNHHCLIMKICVTDIRSAGIAYSRKWMNPDSSWWIYFCMGGSISVWHRLYPWWWWRLSVCLGKGYSIHRGHSSNICVL